MKIDTTLMYCISMEQVINAFSELTNSVYNYLLHDKNFTYIIQTPVDTFFDHHREVSIVHADDFDDPITLEDILEISPIMHHKNGRDSYFIPLDLIIHYLCINGVLGFETYLITN